MGKALAFANVLAIAVVREASRDGRAGAFTLGLGQLFQILAARPDVEHLDDYAALIGRDFARLAQLRGVHVLCKREDFVVIPLRPILADLRDQVFS